MRNPGVVWVMLAVAGLATGVLFSCSGPRPTQPNTEPPVPTTLQWVGTEVLYRDVPGKHDHSLLFVLATWCGWCKKLKAETLTDSTVIHILGKSFNIAQIDPDSDTLVAYADSSVTCRGLARTIYRVTGYPTVIVLNREGRETSQIVGFRTATALVKELEQILGVP
ncbi:MAG: thioredoxin fold domain-containing protein [Candidatus Zixiibacteriota bacterium]